MTFDNKKKAIQLRFSSFIMVVLTVVLIVIVIYTEITSPLIAYGITKNTVIAGIIAVLFAISLWRYILNLHYVYYSDEGEKITLRYSSLRPLNKSKKAIVVDKERYENFKVEKKLFGLKPYLFLSVKNDLNKVVTYPPVCLSGLNKKQRSQMMQSLKSMR